MEPIKELIVEFVNFRNKFTNRQWAEINKVFEQRKQEKADQVGLDDFDLKTIIERIDSIL